MPIARDGANRNDDKYRMVHTSTSVQRLLHTVVSTLRRLPPPSVADDPDVRALGTRALPHQVVGVGGTGTGAVLRVGVEPAVGVIGRRVELSNEFGREASSDEHWSEGTSARAAMIA